MISIENLTVRFGGVVALDHIGAEFSANVSGLIGPNGAGKTTTMNVISGFLDAHNGHVIVEGTDLVKLAPHKRVQWGLRRSFQKEQIANDLTVRENLMAITDHLRGARVEKRADLERAAEFAGVTGILGKMGRDLNTFERRLTDVARCVIGHPKMIMFDEPAGGLTPEETERLGDLILGIHDLTGAKVLVIDHDVELIERICAETLVLDFGKRVAFGPTSEVLRDPAVQAAYLGIDVEEEHA
ncbi:ABC transporter ATP-binding protein [Celeribacter neptunius]|uniref:Amino acid/amide ABC transporter ATP-binding protein 1, HAAT family (TC 3.A.1.4.-) n=1 Tax=Celeribacter neptunius TaxID=588602 RepID=A0A1I3UAM1_9RHOB|nr:ATP-binding cassette domain-containing protein [Celeribacter neptunius]SFJ79669.1 amino acid/amide ABC transporter ATP-binding protein 1, HAAT family (TC 3.A.1.4.-) [Celeribacter neptunius]